MSYNYPSSSLVKSAASINAKSLGQTEVILIVALVAAIVGSILTYVLFLRKENEGKYTGFAKWLYEFLQFSKLYVEEIVKFTYIFLVIFVTISSFTVISTNFMLFLYQLIVGNIELRVAYELIKILIEIHKNVKELNEKTKK